MKDILVGLVCLLFVCTLANAYETTQCREYKNKVIPAKTPDAPALAIFNSSTKVSGTFQLGNPKRVHAYELQAKANSPCVCLSTAGILNIIKKECMVYGFTEKVKFEHYDLAKNNNNEGRVFVIQVYFTTRGNSKTVLLDVPVFGTDDRKNVNVQLEKYLQDLKNQRGSSSTTHVFDWTETALKSTAKLVKDNWKTMERKIYYAHCQYVSKDTLAKIITAFGWN